MKYFVSFLLALVIVPSLASAQSLSNTTVSADDITGIINLTASPEIPGPNQSVTLSLDASGIDLDTANISWSVNGANVKSGKGATTLITTTGSAGTQTKVTATITTSTKTYTESLTLASNSVDLLWEAEDYIPPFYEGRSLWSHQGGMTLLAIPHVVSGGKTLNPASLIYRWTKDGTVLGNTSGVGQNSLVFADSILSQSTTVTVDVMTDQSTVVATATRTFTPGNPLALVYENSPLYGTLFNNAFGDAITLNKSEVTFQAVPYFFTVFTGGSTDPSIAWSTNTDASAGTGTNITFRTPSGTSGGQSSVSLAITGNRMVTQSAEKNFLVQFGNQNSL